MRNKYFTGLLAGIAGISAVLLLYTSAAAFAESFSHANNQAVVKQLVMARIDAMNRFYASEMSYIEASGELRKVESGQLLDEDTTNLRRYFRTDIEEVQSYEIMQITLKEQTENLLCADVEILWNVSGLDGPDELRITYFAACEKAGETFKLVEFF